ncbi:glycosyltransferase [Alteromonas oceanisediminis]|uniref:glycosyltransferase n=1 Tax=Alteromonas oceanisediminis TaxID=2836180 RepID=UPI001BD96203|nr:glycosyltransferase [Alteromonas oceanisediminis]MBT0587082.1 glycosyltransferase [Alteromonas oceanisediminis]
MKLAVIAHPRFPIRSPYAGGLEAFIGSIVCKYQSAFELTLYAHPDSEVDCELVGFDMCRDDYGRFPDIVENDFMLKVMTDIEKRKFDVIHNNSLNPIPLLWASKNSIPLLTTLHTPPYSKLKSAAGLASYSPFVHFTAVSQSLAEAWKPFVNDRISVTYNGIDLDKWKVDKKPQDFVFTYGRILPSKGIDIAIRAAHRLNIPIKIAGPVANEKYMSEEVLPLLKGNDEYLGHLDHRQIKSTLATSNAAVFGTRWDEPFGLATLETMATGTPVASFNRGAFAEIVKEGAGVLAAGNNVKSLAEALDASLLLSGTAATESASNFPLSKMCDSYSSILSRIA